MEEDSCHVDQGPKETWATRRRVSMVQKGPLLLRGIFVGDEILSSSVGCSQPLQRILTVLNLIFHGKSPGRLFFRGATKSTEVGPPEPIVTAVAMTCYDPCEWKK